VRDLNYWSTPKWNNWNEPKVAERKIDPNEIVSMGKKYTSDGKPARILCTDADGDYPVAALIDGEIKRFTIDGLWRGICFGGDVDLKEDKS